MTGENTQTSLREDIEAARQSVEEKAAPIVDDMVVDDPIIDEEEVEETQEEKAARERDEKGRFKAKESEEQEDDGLEIEAQSKEQPTQELRPPRSLKGEMKAKWKELSQDVQQEFIRLESTQAKGIANIANSARFGEEVMSEVQPYLVMIQSEGATPQQAIRSLLNTAYRLRTASPAQKTQLFHQLAQQYGVDLSSPPEQTQVDPNQQYLLKEIQQLRQQVTGQLTANQQAEESSLLSVIERFGQDPANPYFYDLEPQIEGILKAGLVEGLTPEERLKDAYDKACWANPEIRSSILAQQKREEDARRKEEQQKLIASKKAAASSLKSNGTGADVVPDGGSLRDTISQLYYGNSQRI